MSGPVVGPILTLEPLVDAVRDGVESAGWELSGLQKTTSQQFEGRWEGESTRSAYLFFHRPGMGDAVSLDVYLDETSRGLQGNLALVAGGPSLRDRPDTGALLRTLGAAAAERLPEGYRTPISVRARIPDATADPGTADVEIRFKLRIPGAAIEAGASAVSALAASTVAAFEQLVRHPALERLLVLD